MTFRVVGGNRADVKVPIELPFDSQGQWAFDETGKPLRSRKPVVIELPRFQFIAPDLHETLAALEADEELTDLERIRLSLKPFVTEQVYELLQQRPIGELEQAFNYWQKQSAIPLGEYLASNGSSKNTRRPSNSTSSTADSDSETSASA